MSSNREEIFQQVTEILVKTCGIPHEEIEIDKSLREDLAIDSLSMVEILAAAEDEFGIRIPDEDAMGLTDIGAIVSYLQRVQSDKIASPVTEVAG
jgi:acyl carrier protein